MAIFSLRSTCFFSFLLILIGVSEYVIVLRASDRHGLSTSSHLQQWEIIDFNERNSLFKSGRHRPLETIGSESKLRKSDTPGLLTWQGRKKDEKIKNEVKTKGDDLLLQVLFGNVNDFQSLSSEQRQHVINILTEKLDELKGLSCDGGKCDGAEVKKINKHIDAISTHPLARSKNGVDKFTHKAPAYSAEPSQHETNKPTVHPEQEGEILVEHSQLKSRALTSYEAAGNDVMFTLRTTPRFHNQRLPLLMDTWITKVNRSNIHLVSDGKDPVWEKQLEDAGIRYINSPCSRHDNGFAHFTRDQLLCCKAGVEMEQLFKAGNGDYNWLCHVDDDMYVLVHPLVRLLSKFQPKTEAVYLGRSGSAWHHPRKVLKGAKFGHEGQSYHFGVGGMYCMSRAMLELAKPYIVGKTNFMHACDSTKEPEDVTIGIVTGVMLNKPLSRTEEIYTHGLHLSRTVPKNKLSEQVAFSYGYGSAKWGRSRFNAISVPKALYSLQEDSSQFRSLHCHLYPEEVVCRKRKKALLRARNLSQ